MGNNCLNCGKSVKNKYCSVSCQNTHQRTGKKRDINTIEKYKQHVRDNWVCFEVNCYKCGVMFEIKEYKVDRPKKDKYFCSRSCANSRIKTDETKLKQSQSAKNSEKVIIANKLSGVARRGKYLGERVMTECLYCGDSIEHKISEHRKYHKECWLKCSGGIKNGSSRGKSGWYKGFWCDSSYELAWVIFNIDNNISFDRNYDGYPYLYNGSTYLYYPDFILENGTFVEIKNYKSELTDAKIRYFPHLIKVLYKEEIKTEILPYVINKYGKDFIKLYD